MDCPPNFLNELHDFLDLPQFDHNQAEDSYITSRAYSNIGKDTWEFEKQNNLGSWNLIATHSPLHQSPVYCSANSSCFSPWAAPEHGGFRKIAFKPEGQLLLKKCLLQMLPWMRNARNSKHYVQPEVHRGFQSVNYTNLKNNEAMAYNDALLMNGNGCTTYFTPGTTASKQQDRTTNKHMLTERTRRRKHKECFQLLQALLPKSPKKDKVSVLQSAIDHLKELLACKENLEKRVEELESTIATHKPLWASGSPSSRQLVSGGGHMNINTYHCSTSINSTVEIMLPSAEGTITSLQNHHDHSEHDIHYDHGTSISNRRAMVSINSSLQADNTVSISVFISARLTLGSDQLVKALASLEDLGMQVLSVESRFQRNIFMAEISARTDKDSNWITEAQIQDSMTKALLTTHFGN